MSAREDYPLLSDATRFTAFEDEAQEALDEIDKLRKWIELYLRNAEDTA